MTGTTPITYNPIPTGEGIIEKMVAPFSITPKRTNFVTTGKNKLDTNNKSSIGNWVNYASGAYQSYPTNSSIANYYYSPSITVVAGDIYIRLYGADSTVFFNKDMTFISGSQANTFTIPTNATWMIINFTNNHMYEQVELGSVSTSYEPYGVKLITPLPSSVTKDMITPNIVSIDKTDFMATGKNLLNPIKLSVANNWLNYTNGVYEAKTGYYYSELIPVLPNTTYTRTYGANSTVFLKKDKSYITGYTTNTFTTSPSTYFVVLNVTSNYVSEQLELNTIATSYETYGTKLLSQLPSSVTKDMLVAKSVSYDKIDFIDLSKNIYNVNTLSATNNWVNYVNGVIQNNEYTIGLQYSKPILLLPNTTYTRKYGSEGTSFFNSSGVFISGLITNTFTTPPTTSYAIINVRGGSTFDQLELGSISTLYEPFVVSTLAPYKGEPLAYALNLPPKLYTLVGKEMNVYFDNLMINDADKYNFNCACTIGRQEKERYTVIPTVTGTKTLTVSVYKDSSDVNDVLTMAKIAIVTAPIDAGSGLNKKIIHIGDSTALGVIATGELLNLFSADVMDITLLGSQGTAPNLCEGYPGKDTNFLYTNALSPFVFSGVFDFTQYMTTKGYASVDFVNIQLGINDVFPKQGDGSVQTITTAVMAQYEGMIASIHAFDANIKIGIMATIPPSRSEDAFGVDVVGMPRWRYKRNVMLFVKQLILQFQNREASQIYVVPYNCNLDTVNNMASQSILANSRSTVSITRQSNSLHPIATGYYQMSDTIYYWLKNMV